MKRFFLIVVFVMPVFLTVVAQQNKVVLLYPNGVPNSKVTPNDYIEKFDSGQIVMVTNPTITCYFPNNQKGNATAVIVCPGGGYGFLASAKEGDAVAKKFNDIGIAAFVLKYRLPSDKIMIDKSIGPLQDAQRAIQLVKENAKEFGIDSNKVGIMGFSAGGHLAVTAGTHLNKAVINNPGNIILRPSFMLLIYPVISFGEFTHKGSKDKLIGKDATTQQIDFYSGEKQVTPLTPPTFLVHAENDTHVPVQNSLLLYESLLKFGVKAEMHLYQAGSHGFGLNNRTTPDSWFDRCKNFLTQNGF